MPDFFPYFKSSGGKPIIYREKVIALSDAFPIKKNGKVLLKIEKAVIDGANDILGQGVVVAVKKGYLIDQNGARVKRFTGWYDSARDNQFILEYQGRGEGELIIYNVWLQTASYFLVTESGEFIERKSREIDYGGYNGAGMIIEEIPNGRRYYCNDRVPDEDFDDLIFTIERIN